MGCYSVSCKLSNLPIVGYTSAVLIPLRPIDGHIEFDFHKDTGTTVICCNEGPLVYFHPCMYPIRGTYNDYGSLNDIIRDDNTDILEEYYGLTIEQIVGVLTSNRKDDGFDKRLCCIKDPSQPDEFGEPIYLERYKDLIKISCNWIHGTLYDELTKTTHDGGDKFENIDAIKRLYRVGPNDKDFDEVLQEFVDEQAEKGMPVSEENKLIEYFSHLHDMNFSSREVRRVKKLLLDFNEYEYNHNPLSNFYFKAVKVGKLKDIATRFYKFNDYMLTMGLFYYPTGTCHQSGDHEGVRTVLKTALGILEQEIADFDR